MDRRNLLKTLGATGATSAAVFGLETTKGLSGPSRAAIDFDSPTDLLAALIKLSGSLDERLTIWWQDGIRYGVMDGKSTPFCGFQIGLFNLHTKISDDAYRVTQFELTYYTDLTSGELLREFENPFTGKTNRLLHVRMGPLIRTQTIEGLLPDQGERAAIKDLETQVGPITVHDGDVWIPTGVSAMIQFPFPNAPVLPLNQYQTFHGKLDHLEDPEIVAAPAQLQFQNVIFWEPWLQMNDHPGHSMGRAWGRKLMSVEDLPDSYLAMAREINPDMIEDPLSLLKARAAKADASP